MRTLFGAGAVTAYTAVAPLPLKNLPDENGRVSEGLEREKEKMRAIVREIYENTSLPASIKEDQYAKDVTDYLFETAYPSFLSSFTSSAISLGSHSLLSLTCGEPANSDDFTPLMKTSVTGAADFLLGTYAYQNLLGLVSPWLVQNQEVYDFLLTKKFPKEHIPSFYQLLAHEFARSAGTVYISASGMHWVRRLCNGFSDTFTSSPH